MKLVIVLFISLFSLNLMAQDERGNGGDAVVCYKDTVNVGSVEFLDVYEMRVLRGLNEIVTNDLSISENIEKVFSVFEKKMPFRIKRYRRWFNDFFTEALLLKDITLDNIPDSHHVVIPNDCEIKQAVIQIKPQFIEDKRYIIDKNLWDKMDNVSRTALILHELIYRNALENDAKNSIGVRYLNSLMLSGTIKHFDDVKYIYNLFKKIPFNSIYYRGVRVSNLIDRFLINEQGIVDRFEVSMGCNDRIYCMLESKFNYKWDGIEIDFEYTKGILNSFSNARFTLDEKENLTSVTIVPSRNIMENKIEVKTPNGLYFFRFSRKNAKNKPTFVKLSFSKGKELLAYEASNINVLDQNFD